SMTFAEAERRPFETILSGPVAGAEGAAELARALELGDVISADVGGTSFDTCLITSGRPQVRYEGRVDGMPVQTPWIDVRSIGAGGGSTAYADVGGAGPVFATLLAHELGIGRIVIPPYAGNFSAWGLLGSDLTQAVARTQILPLSDEGLGVARSTLDDLFAQLDARTDSVPEVRLDVRYVGQEHTLTVAADPAAGADAVRSVFTEEYERTF